MNRAAAHLQKPGRLAERRGARAFRTTRQLLIVEASARASAAKSRRDKFNLQWPATSAAGIDAVYVNGRAVWHDGAATDARPGKALRRAA